MIPIGSRARLVQPVVEGEVIDTRFVRENGGLEHLLAFEDADGEPQQRWFTADHLEAAP